MAIHLFEIYGKNRISNGQDLKFFNSLIMIKLPKNGN